MLYQAFKGVVRAVFPFLNKAIDKAHKLIRRLIYSVVKYAYYLEDLQYSDCPIL
jgi:hypothetical protein